jgi:sensor histidine kinase regulating citrate/malate metabolism
MMSDDEVRLAAIAIVELTRRQTAAPDEAGARLEELEAVLQDVDAGMVAVDLAGVLIAVADTCRLPLGELLAQMRSGVLAGE